MVINSKQNAIIKYAFSLKDKKGVIKNGECLVESEKLVKELIASKHTVSAVLCCETYAQKFAYILQAYKGKIYYISAEISKYLADSVTTSGIFAFVKLPNAPTDIVPNTNFLVLENLQDPTNFGALIRSARAFGYNTIYMIGGVFPYSYKTIRSSMGYVFDVEIINSTISELKGLNLPIFVGDMNGEDLSNVTKNTKRFGIAIGNEGSGASTQLKQLATRIIKIPMQNNVESLNASVSGGILMYNLSLKN